MAGKPNRIYIDAYTGNWGDADDIVTLVVTDDEIEELSEMTDRQIRDFAARAVGVNE